MRSQERIDFHVEMNITGWLPALSTLPSQSNTVDDKEHLVTFHRVQELHQIHILPGQSGVHFQIQHAWQLARGTSVIDRGDADLVGAREFS